MYKKSTWNLAQKNMKKLGIYDQKPWENLEFCIWKKPCTSHCMLKGEGLKRRLNDDVHIPVPSTCIPSWGEGIETPYSTGSSWRPPSMHCLLSFIFFTFFILWPLSPAASSVSWYWSSLVCSGLAYEMYSGVGPSTYVYCVVCYCVIVALYVRSVGHVFAYLYTLDDNSECPVDYETSLLSKVFFFPSTTTSHHSENLFTLLSVWKSKHNMT